MKKSRIALMIGIAGISIFPILVKLGLTSGLVSAFYRMFFALIILLPIVIFRKQFKWPTGRLILLSLLCGVLFGADVAVWNIAIEESTATQATLLTNLSPIWVGIGAFFFLVDKPKTNFWFGTVVALLGMMIIVGFEFFANLEFDRSFYFGILSGVFYSWYFLISKSILDKMNVPTFMTINLVGSVVFLGVINYVAGENFFNHSAAAWSVLIIQSVTTQLIGWFALNYAISRMRATRVSLSLLSQSLITAILAWLILSEPITMQMFLGCLVLLSGIAMTFVSKPLWAYLIPKKLIVFSQRRKRAKLNMH